MRQTAERRFGCRIVALVALTSFVTACATPATRPAPRAARPPLPPAAPAAPAPGAPPPPPAPTPSVGPREAQAPPPAPRVETPPPTLAPQPPTAPPAPPAQRGRFVVLNFDHAATLGRRHRRRRPRSWRQTWPGCFLRPYMDNGAPQSRVATCTRNVAVQFR